VPVGEGMQPVPLKIAEKIWAWEFVDMVDLLPEQWAVKKDVHLLAQLMPARRRRQIEDINVWLQCFISYVSVMSRRFPSDVVELLAYMAHIHRTSLEFPDKAWVEYDTTFRMQAASSGNRRWSCVNPSIYAVSFSGKASAGKRCELCSSSAHATRECSLAADDVDVAYGWRMVKSVVASLASSSQETRPSGNRLMLADRRESQSAPEVCRRFNAGKCVYAKCARRHVCSACDGSHPAISCPRSSKPYPSLS